MLESGIVAFGFTDRSTLMVRIFSDSSCDISDELLAARQITRIPFYVSFDQVEYSKEIEEISLAEFYKRLTSEKIFPKTSLPTIEDYCRHFRSAVKNGDDVLCICITPLFSGSFQSATNAKDLILEDYPNAKIRIVNSMQATGAQGLTVLAAADMRDAGFSLDEIAAKLGTLVTTSRIIFTVGTLEYLRRGGRIGKVSALAGSLLHIQPLIELYDGELMPYGTVRGRKKALHRIVEITGEYFEKNELSFEDYTFGVISGESAMEECLQVRIALEALTGQMVTLDPFSVGVTIGTYTGPDPVGITFIRKYNS